MCANTGSLEVPKHLRNALTRLLEALGHGAGYRHAHDEPDAEATAAIRRRMQEGYEASPTRPADRAPWRSTAKRKRLAFVNWMAYFFPNRVMKQEIAEIALRRARLLD